MPTSTRYWSAADGLVFQRGPAGVTSSWELNFTQQARLAEAAGLWDDVSNLTMVQAVDDDNLARSVNTWIEVRDIFGFVYDAYWEVELTNDWTRISIGTFSDPDTWGVNRPNGRNWRYHEVYIDVDNEGVGSFQLGSHAFYTLLHEMGHSIVVDHISGSDEQTVMNASHGDDPSAWEPSTPMTLDIDRSIARYGASTTTRTGDDTYGFNAHFSGPYRAALDFSVNSRPLITIYDNGGRDTLDASRFSSSEPPDTRPVHVDLRQGVDHPSYMLDGSNETFAIIYSTTWIENAVGGNNNDELYGNSINNVLRGNDGNDLIWGDAGHDTMVGGAGYDGIDDGTGSDEYYVDHPFDYVVEEANGGEVDSVHASISYTLPENVENLYLDGDLIFLGDVVLSGSFSGNVNGTGNSAGNLIVGNTGSNLLSGMGGDDFLYGVGGVDIINGGGGVDTAFLDGTRNSYTIAETAGGGVLVAGSPGTFLLTSIEALQFSNLRVQGVVLSGSPAGETLARTFLADQLDGAGGSDMLLAGSGDDILRGEAGADTLTGGFGSDTFVLGATDLTDARAASPLIDVIVDYNRGGGTFNAAEGDRIDLSGLWAALSSPVLRFAGLHAFLDANGTTTLEIDTNGPFFPGGWLTVAQLTGLHAGDQIAAIRIASQAPINVTVAHASQTTNYPDGSHTTQYWDVHDQRNWTDYFLRYDSQNRLTEQTIHFDDGTRAELGYDTASQNNWTDFRNDYDSQNQLTAASVRHDNGTRAEVGTDVANQYNWASYRVDYHANGQSTGQIINYDNGSRRVVGYDAANQFNWTDSIVDYDSLNQLAGQTIYYDDGSQTLVLYDLQNQNPWSEVSQTYDTQNALTAQTIRADDGTRADYLWDPQDQAPWSSIISYYDAQGIFLSQDGTYDDGSTWHTALVDLGSNHRADTFAPSCVRSSCGHAVAPPSSETKIAPFYLADGNRNSSAGGGSQPAVVTSRRPHPVHSRKLPHLCSAANGRRVPLADSNSPVNWGCWVPPDLAALPGRGRVTRASRPSA